MGYSVLRGQFCHFVICSLTVSVTLDISIGDMFVPYIFLNIATIYQVIIILAYRKKISLSICVIRIWLFYQLRLESIFTVRWRAQFNFAIAAQ